MFVGHCVIFSEQLTLHFFLSFWIIFELIETGWRIDTSVNSVLTDAVCRLFGINSLPEPVFTHSQMHPRGLTSIKVKSGHNISNLFENVASKMADIMLKPLFFVFCCCCFCYAGRPPALPPLETHNVKKLLIITSKRRFDVIIMCLLLTVMCLLRRATVRAMCCGYLMMTLASEMFAKYYDVRKWKCLPHQWPFVMGTTGQTCQTEKFINRHLVRQFEKRIPPTGIRLKPA